MSIKYLCAGPKRDEYIDDFPPDAKTHVHQILEAVDDIYPGILDVLKASHLRIVYDPLNYHAMFSEDPTDKATYCWPLHALYLAENGINHSVPHQVGYILDFLAGPTAMDVYRKHGLPRIETFSVYSVYPKGGKFNDKNVTETVNKETNFQAWFILNAITHAAIARKNGIRARSILSSITSSKLGDGSKIGDFICTRMADLFEEFYFEECRAAGSEPIGVWPTGYFEQDHFWGSEWITANRADIRDYFSEIIRIGQERSNSDKLSQRVNELLIENVIHEERLFSQGTFGDQVRRLKYIVKNLESAPPSLDLAEAHLALSHEYTVTQQPDKSQLSLKDAEKVLYKLDPTSTENLRGNLLFAKATKTADNGKPVLAIKLLKEAIALGERSQRNSDDEIIQRYGFLAELLALEMGDYSEACVWYKKTFELLKQQNHELEPENLIYYTIYIFSLLEAGDFTQAKLLLSTAKEIASKIRTRSVHMGLQVNQAEVMAIESYYHLRTGAHTKALKLAEVTIKFFQDYDIDPHYSIITTMLLATVMAEMAMY